MIKNIFPRIAYHKGVPSNLLLRRMHIAEKGKINFIKCNQGTLKMAYGLWPQSRVKSKWWSIFRSTLHLHKRRGDGIHWGTEADLEEIWGFSKFFWDIFFLELHFNWLELKGVFKICRDFKFYTILETRCCLMIYMWVYFFRFRKGSSIYSEPTKRNFVVIIDFYILLMFTNMLSRSLKCSWSYLDEPIFNIVLSRWILNESDLI